MNDFRERPLVYTALLIACSVIGLAAGPVEAIWSFAQVAIIIEFVCWLGTHRGGVSRRRF